MILFSDEAGVTLDAKLGIVWGLKGQQPVVPSSSPFGTVNLIGFVNPVEGSITVNKIRKGDSDNFIEQLKMVKNRNRRYKRITVYVDNARWHKSKKVKEWLKFNKRIRLRFLPKYAPELNPMERHWWYLRKKKTKNQVFDSYKECWKNINEHFNQLNKEQIVRLCQI